MENATRVKPFFYLLGIVTAAFSIFAAVLMTEPGQSLDLPRAWVVGYFELRWLMIAINLALLAGLWWLNGKYRFLKSLWLWLASAGVITCIIAANFLLVLFFPSYQHGANYISVAEADAMFADEDVFYAIELNGEVRGYPRKHLEIPHIAGAKFGDDEVIMTFCALSNLPVVYPQDIGTGESDIGILIQVHNNLVMVDRKSNELIQQITGRTEFSNKKLRSYPNEMMTWASFKQLYPDAEVFVYEFNRVVDSFLLAIFEGPMEKQFSEEHGAIFPTLNLTDTRLPNKEQVWGLDISGEQAAFTLAFMQQNPTFAFELGGRPLLIHYDSQYGTVNLFDRSIDGEPISVSQVDRRGKSPSGSLKKLPMHNGVFWMVWSHWFPETRVFN